MAVESRTQSAAPQRAWSEPGSYLEQRLFVISPFNLWITGALLYAALVGLFALASAIDAAPWIVVSAGGYAIDPRARAALILALVVVVALVMQRYTRLLDTRDMPLLHRSLTPAATQAFVASGPPPLLVPTVAGAAIGLAIILAFYLPGHAGAAPLGARTVWYALASMAIGVLFGRGVAMTRAASRATQAAIRDGLEVDLLQIDRLYGWGRMAARGSLTRFAVCAATLLLFISDVRPLVATIQLLACAGMGVWVFLGTIYGVHRRIREAKSGELAEVRAEIGELRRQLAAQPAAAGRLHSLLAYEARIADAPEWPFDQTTIVRLAGSSLLLAVPWFGQAVAGVIVERVGQFTH